MVPIYRAFLTRCCVFGVEHLHEVVDVGGGQPQRLDLGELGVARDVGDAVAQRRKRVVDGLGSTPLLLVATGPELDTDRPGPLVAAHDQAGSCPAEVAVQASEAS